MTTRRERHDLLFSTGRARRVSIEAAKWQRTLAALGHRVTTVAGEGEADHLVAGLASGDRLAPDAGELAEAFAGAEVVIVENVCSLPLHPAASRAVAQALAGRPAILRHHDLSLERPHLAHYGPPPSDPHWVHVCISQSAASRLAEHGLEATVAYNLFDVDPPPGDRAATRRALRVGDDERLVLQPTRAIARKNVPGGIALAEALGATYWLTGAVEDGYDNQLAEVFGLAHTPVIHAPMPEGARGASDAYAACDLVVLPSTLEGFGNPAIEAAIHRRPLAVGPYGVGAELRALGFSWLDVDNWQSIATFLDQPDPAPLQANAALAAERFSLQALPAQLAALLARATGTISQ